MNLQPLFAPKSIALIGASRRQRSVGHGILQNLVRGSAHDISSNKPFKGPIYPINPNAKRILGRDCYQSILSVKGKVDLAIIAVPAKLVDKIIDECIEKKVSGVIIISAGFSEYNEEGKALQQEIVKKLKKANIPMVGPNCLGIINPNNSMNASFAPAMPVAGSVAFISQSGALVDSIIDWAIENRYGFSSVVSYGNKAMLDATDYLEYFAKDKNTKVITLYLEGLSDGRRFMQAAKKITKPIIVLKAGRSKAGMQAISSHTGSLAGSYDIYKAAFKQAGIIVADTVEELFDNAKALAHMPFLKAPVAIVTNGGGCGVLCADYLSELGVPLAELKEAILKKLDASGKMHPAYSRRNPLDLVGDARPERYEVALRTLLKDASVGGLIVIQTLQTTTDPEEDAEVVIKAHASFPEKPILCVYMGGHYTKNSVSILERRNIPDYSDLKKAALAMKALYDRGKAS